MSGRERKIGRRGEGQTDRVTELDAERGATEREEEGGRDAGKQGGREGETERKSEKGSYMKRNGEQNRKGEQAYFNPFTRAPQP